MLQAEPSTTYLPKEEAVEDIAKGSPWEQCSVSMGALDQLIRVWGVAELETDHTFGLEQGQP